MTKKIPIKRANKSGIDESLSSDKSYLTENSDSSETKADDKSKRTEKILT